MVAFLSIGSPIGFLSLFDVNGSLVAVEFGRVPDNKETPLLAEARKQLKAFFAGKLRVFNLPLSPPGTAYQRRVWDVMAKIPYGQVRSYGDIADDLGSSPRSVGGACGRNPIPIILPCHRVIGAGGRLIGYSGGEDLETKRYLLNLEGVNDPRLT